MFEDRQEPQVGVAEVEEGDPFALPVFDPTKPHGLHTGSPNDPRRYFQNGHFFDHAKKLVAEVK